MLAFFRRIINSKLGLIVTFVTLGVVALAFGAGNITGLATSAGVGGGDVATVGKEGITVADLRLRAQNTVDAQRQEQPTFDMTQFLGTGGLQTTLDRLISATALARFGLNQGMDVSRRSVDGQIASIPAFQGPNGKFDPALYQQALAQRHLTDKSVRQDFYTSTLTDQLTQPTLGASQVPDKVALPYASLLMEQRSGQVGFIPTAAIPAGPAPSDADLAAFYTRAIQRYTLPQRRVIRYAVVTPATVAASATPSDAEIAHYYQQHADDYAAKEKRTIAQVVVLDQAGAQAIAAKAKGGATLEAAAQAAGLAAATQTSVDKATYAKATAPAVADAVFAAPSGAIVGPVQGGLGWTVAKVESVVRVAAQSPAQAHGAIVAALTKAKTTQALGDLQNRIDDALSRNATFAEVMQDNKLSAETTPPLGAQGTNPEDPGFTLAPELKPILPAAFQAEEGDPPQLAAIGNDGSFAVVGLDRIVAAAPRPLASVRAQVERDFRTTSAAQAARRIAADVVAKVNKGAALSAALSQTGLSIPGPRPLGASRAQLASSQQGVPEPLIALFGMKPNTARLIAAPHDAGWIVVRLDTIKPGDAAGNNAAVNAAKNDLGRGVGREYVEQFVTAVRKTIGVKTNPSAIASVRAELSGQGGSDPGN